MKGIAAWIVQARQDLRGCADNTSLVNQQKQFKNGEARAGGMDQHTKETVISIPPLIPLGCEEPKRNPGFIA
jgi:hypothetical protein